MNIKTEIWNGHEIRFVEKEPSDWWAVAKDVAGALEYVDPSVMVRKLRPNQKGEYPIPTPGGPQRLVIISEQGLYKVIMRSNKPEAQAFEDWVYNVIKTLRQASGLEGFQIFRMVDRKYQREEMRRLCDGLRIPVKVNFIKANTITNKAVSTMFGYPKELRKAQMTPEMLVKRQPILADTVTLMITVDAFGLDLSVSQIIYKKYTASAGSSTWPNPPNSPDRLNLDNFTAKTSPCCSAASETGRHWGKPWPFGL